MNLDEEIEQAEGKEKKLDVLLKHLVKEKITKQ